MDEYRIIMGEFRRQGITYIMWDFACVGGFISVIMNKYPTIMIACPDLGRRPHKGEWNPDVDQKLREKALPPLQPFSNPHNLHILSCVQMGKHFILCEMKEMIF